MKSAGLKGFFATLLVTALPALAEGPGLIDGGKFFTPAGLDAGAELIKEIKRNSKIDVRVETFAQVPADKQESYAKLDQAGKNKFFNDWLVERAKASRVAGLFILICREPAKIKVHASQDGRTVGLNESVEKKIGEILVSNFKKKNFDDGLKEALAYCEESIKMGKTQTAEHRRNGIRGGNPVGNKDQGFGGLIVVALMILVGMVVMSFLFRGMGGGGMGPGMGGGGFLGSLLAGMGGAFLGNWLYGSFFGNHSNAGGLDSWSSGGDSVGGPDGYSDGEWSSGGGDFGGGDFGGGDMGGGGDFGGGDF